MHDQRAEAGAGAADTDVRRHAQGAGWPHHGMRRSALGNGGEFRHHWKKSPERDVQGWDGD